jgi:hypothetical protein
MQLGLSEEDIEKGIPSKISQFFIDYLHNRTTIIHLVLPLFVDRRGLPIPTKITQSVPNAGVTKELRGWHEIKKGFKDLISHARIAL